MSYVFSALLVALTALTWLLFVTLAPDADDWSLLLREAAYFLTAISVARIVEVLVNSFVDDADGNSRTTDLVKVMSSIVIYVAAVLVWLHYGLAFDITNLLATSAIVSLVIGFALQNTLGNLFSGLSLELERPLRAGDFIRKGAIEGEVEALKWRSIFLRTADGGTVVLPNSALATDAVEVVRRGAPFRSQATFHVPADIPPMIVLETVREVLANGVPGVTDDPPGSAVVLGTEAQTGVIRYGARFYSLRPIELSRQTSAVLTGIWYALDRKGIPMTAAPEGLGVPAGAAPRRSRGAGSVMSTELGNWGTLLRFGPGEALPADLTGIVVDGMLREEVLADEFDLSAAVGALLEADHGVERLSRLDPALLREISRQAAVFLGPIAFTLAEHFAGLTDDPFFVYQALATRIPEDADKTRFLALAPARPVRRLGPGAPVGWAGYLGLEPMAARRRSVPVQADIMAFDRGGLAKLMASPEGEHLVDRLARLPQLHDRSREAIRDLLTTSARDT